MENKYIGSDFDDFLEQEGLFAEVEANAIKRAIACHLAELMQKENISKTDMAKRMNTSRSSIDRLLDPRNESVTLQTLERAALALGKRLEIKFVGAQRSLF
ncbi:MAG: helix-turn-helix transcriptional regulator [candidate division KSB1 bacterium]|nr:helix-turn-helix transcriptional regulator [candidate division KSB1 bacterium]